MKLEAIEIFSKNIHFIVNLLKITKNWNEMILYFEFGPT